MKLEMEWSIEYELNKSMVWVNFDKLCYKLDQMGRQVRTIVLPVLIPVILIHDAMASSMAALKVLSY